MITPQKKLELKRQFQKDPALGVLMLLDQLRAEQKEDIKKEIDIVRKEVAKETVELFEKKLVGLQEQIPTLAKILQDIHGRDGDDADAEDVAAALLDMPEFLEAVQGNPGETPTEERLVALIKSVMPSKEELRGEKGEAGTPAEAIDPKEVATILLNSAVFKAMVKGEKGDKGDSGSPDTAIQTAEKLNTLSDAVRPSVIDGLVAWMKKVEKALRERKRNQDGGGTSGGGGMGNWVHQVFSVGSSTTQVVLANKVAAGGNAMFLRYQGQLQDHTVHYSSPGTGKVVPLLFTPNDSTFISVTYVRA